MQIIGYYIHKNKQYAVFTDNATRNGSFKITDGFHDKAVTKRDMKRNGDKFIGHQHINEPEIDVKKIASRMRGTRPWHPLLKILMKESTV